MRVVLDTGILIAALIAAGTPPDRIYQARRRKRFRLLTSRRRIGEFRRASRYEKLRPYLQPAEAGSLVNGLRQSAIVLRLPPLDLSPDPNDNAILAMAVAGKADYLVSGDKRGLLSIGRIATRGLSPRANFLPH
jgi:uncharacterized protein